MMRAIGEGHHGTFTHHLGASAQKRVGARFSHFPLFAYQPSHKRRRVATRREARSLVSPSPCVFPLRPPRIHHDGVRREEEPVRSLESIPARLHVWPPTKLHPGDRSVHQVRNRHERPGAERTCDGRAGCHLARRFTSRRPGPGITCPFASTGIVPSGSDGTESSCECRGDNFSELRRFSFSRDACHDSPVAVAERRRLPKKTRSPSRADIHLQGSLQVHPRVWHARPGVRAQELDGIAGESVGRVVPFLHLTED